MLPIPLPACSHAHVVPILKQLPPPTGNVFGSSANLIKAIIGSGVLGLPAAFSKCGWVLAMIVLLFSAVITSFGLYFTCKCGGRVGDRSANFGGVAYATVKWIAPITDFFLFMTSFGGCISYLMIAGDSIPPFITGVAGVTDGILLSRQLWISIVWVVIGIPLTCARNINFLSYFSAFAIIFVWYIAVLVVLFYVDPGTPLLEPCLGKPDPCVGSIEAFKFESPLNFMKTMPTFVFALGCAPQILPVFNELKNPTIRRVNTMLAIVVGVVMVIYTAVGVCGYFTYGDSVSSNILNDYPVSILATVARAAIAVSVSISYPLNTFPGRQSLVHAVNLICEITGKHELLEVGCRFQTILYWTITVVILVSTYLLALFVADLGVVFSLSGSLASSTLGFTLPGFFFFYLFKAGEEPAFMRGLAVFLTLFGLGFSVLGTVTTFM